MRGRRVRDGDVLRQEELELLVREGAQLRAEHIVDSDMVCVPTGAACQSRRRGRCGAGVAVKPHSRQIGHGKRRVTVEMVGFNEPLEQIPTHLGRFIGARREKGGRTACSTLKDAVASNGSMGHPTGFRGARAAGAELELWNCGASSPDTAALRH